MSGEIAPPYLKFEVYAGVDGSIYGQTTGCKMQARDSVVWISTKFGIPVDMAFAEAKQIAAETNISSIVIEDPSSLWPNNPALKKK